jgi:4-amino-4-deoxy-L-arabinose transferase-like glycosyltransferase
MRKTTRTSAISSTDHYAKTLWWGLAIVGAGFALLFMVIAWLRMQYPFELEWMEGAIVDHVRRITAGLPVYVQPSLDLIPFIYTPVYYYVSALASTIFGEGFLPLRLVSLLSTVANFSLIFVLIRRETRETVYALVGVGLFAASYRVCGAWFDIGRVDSLALLFVLTSVFVLRNGQTRRDLIVAGVLLAVAYLTKQSCLIIGITLGLYFVYDFRWKALWYIGALAITIVGTTILCDAYTDEWFSYYVYELPKNHTMDFPVIVSFWTKDIL